MNPPIDLTPYERAVLAFYCGDHSPIHHMNHGAIQWLVAQGLLTTSRAPTEAGRAMEQERREGRHDARR